AGASGRLGLYPPPCGEGRREAPGWGSCGEPLTAPPTPNPSPQGGGEYTECAALKCLNEASSPQTRPQIARGLLELGGKRCRRIVFRQPQAHAGDATVRHPMRHQRDRPERHDVALLRPALAFF